MKRILFTLLAVAAMVSCTKNEDYAAETQRTAATFTSSIDTRVSSDGESWDTAENIGITMVTLSTDDVETLESDNINYVSTNNEVATSVGFQAATSSETLLYPNSGSVKFYAYYPYQSTVTGGSYLYAADVSDQTENIDFMVAAPVTTARTSAAVNLLFSHKLAKLTISITGNDNVTDLDGVTTSVLGFSTTGNYDIRTGLKSGDLDDSDVSIDFNMSYGTANDDGDITSATATAIILPESLSSAATVTFTLGDRVFTVEFPEDTAFTAGYNHSYAVALGNDYASFVGSSTIIGWKEYEFDDDDVTDLPSEETTSDITLVDGVYQINTALGLQAFAALVNGDSRPKGLVAAGSGFAKFGTANADIDALLMNDIDLVEICYTYGPNWTPIGDYSTKRNDVSPTYEGTFDGDGHKVSNLYINASTKYQGLFGRISGATIQNLGVDGSVTSSAEHCHIGGIVGDTDSSSITACYNLCDVIASGSEGAYIGGIVGNSDASITACYNAGAISAKLDGDVYIGGIAGQSGGSITSCYSYGSVSSADGGDYYDNLGGVAGYSTSIISYCYYDTTTVAAAGEYYPSYAVGGNGASGNSGTVYCGLTTTEMTTEGTLLDYLQTDSAGAADYWTVDYTDTDKINNGYPILSWQ